MLKEEKQAILVIPVFGTPDIVVDRKFVGSGKVYHFDSSGVWIP